MSEVSYKDGFRTARWADLEDELDRWEETGRIATLWWRDDDAIRGSDRLDRLIAIAAGVPISLAVIPAPADAQLPEWLAHPSRAATPVAVLQHGWQHTNHALNGKKSEFPLGRSRLAVASDLAAGRVRLTLLFGARALAVLVPPWNRIEPSFLPVLMDCGLTGVSRVKPRPVAHPVPKVAEVNVHVDLVSWAGDRGFIGEATALGAISAHLRARRLSEIDADEPTGILTHHLVQDEQTEVFLRHLIALTRNHPATRWLEGTSVFSEAVYPSQ
ncbi:MAG: polysaccharide deacetylase family protein [Alphaproteobacteria bacterium]|nr:polysaccharide deacetylase family protein [Alphaproteobacteria bacterium]MBV8334306.1 polysaccharide deacetylase family protein [Alphaproteobacteria bacterium]